MRTNMLDRAILSLAPRLGLSRIRARAAADMVLRHFDAASMGRRTSGWPRSSADANLAGRLSIGILRDQARDMCRNNAWARRGKNVISNHTVGWGIIPKATSGSTANISQAWKRWANSTDADADGRMTYYGIQRLVTQTVVEAGEVLVRRRVRQPRDGLDLPLQLQVLEPDFLDIRMDQMMGIEGGPIIQGIEFDAIGRRIAYYIFDQHPGSQMFGNFQSHRVPASEIIHVYCLDRPGQARGVTWFSPILLRLRDFDEWEDATLMRQKIAALFAAFVTDPDGTGPPLGEGGTDTNGAGGTAQTDTIEPGTIVSLAPGRGVEFANPPTVVDPSFSPSTLRFCAAGLGITYEDLTGDYSQVNFSSARMSRIEHWSNVHDWRWNMLVPQFCAPTWSWAVNLMVANGLASPDSFGAVASWTPPPQPMLDPEKEGLATMRMVRAGMKTYSEMVREQGGDPEEHWREYAEDQALLDKLAITLDSDARKVSQAGQEQMSQAQGQDQSQEASPAAA